ncbi:TetR/AcrR family transcriptional regulator [Rouxiella sp. Mn2063]|uniref:TetR/AcrR family transcriptional regulator n=1 Tax=Rouxiella sp. Mn2063 TaxID=3395262 RepID=UPI003BE3A25E
MNTKNTTEIPDRLLDAAEALIYQHGLNATGMEQIVKKTGIARKTIYRYFSNKDDLCAQALQHRDKRWMRWFEESSCVSDSPEACLLAMFDALKSWFQTEDFRGCAFINSAGETADPHHPVRVIAKEHKVNILRFITRLAEKAHAKTPQALANQLLVLIDGAITVAMLMGNPAAADDAKETAKVLINSQIN